MTCPIFFRNTLITLEPVLVTHFDFLRASVKGWRWDFTWELSPGFSTAEGGSLSVVAASPWKPLRAAPPPHWSGPRSRDHGSGMITLTGWIFKGPPRWMRVRAQAQSTESCGAVMLQQWAALHDMRGHWRQGPSDDPKLNISPSLSIWRLWGPTKTAQKTHLSPPNVGAAQVFWYHPHKVMIFRGGQGIPLMPYSSPSHKRTSGAAAPSTCCDAFRELWPWGECNLPTNVQNSSTRRWHQISPPCYSKLVIYKNKSVSWKHVSRDLFTRLSFMPLLLCSGKREKEQFFFQYFHGFTE